ncbi:MAG: hypothetical protein ACXACI_13495 [Candidatus Hodarchaeales archaeon]|jgi:hypothetical protein
MQRNIQGRLAYLILLLTLFMNLNAVALSNGGNATSQTIIDDGNLASAFRKQLPSLVSSQGPSIGTPRLNSSNPSSTDAVKVMATINDTDGIKNATLFWEYQSINSTSYNATMTEEKLAVVSAPPLFDEYYFVNSTGDEVATPRTWKLGNYSIVAQPSETLSEINVSISVSDADNNLTYVNIEFRNQITGAWTAEFTTGAIGATADLGTVTFSSTKLVSGYRIIAITHQGSHPNRAHDPLFDYLFIYQGEGGYAADILPPNKSTIVAYFIQAFDLLDNLTTSITYTFQMGTPPTVTIVNLPDPINGTQDLILNVSVSDPDGVGNINKSSGIGFYRFEADSSWSSVPLTHLHDLLDGLTAEFAGTIPSSALQGHEGVLHVIANCSDILGLEGSSGDQITSVDDLAPRVNDITLSGGVPAAGLNVTLISVVVNITATFEDAAGISSVSIYYAIPNDTAPLKKAMVNTTAIGPAIVQADFNVSLPAANETAFINYFFETEDYLGNIGNTSVNIYYADGEGPLLSAFEIFPPLITNNTDVAIVFNASDYSGISTSILWYSYDNGTTWSSTPASALIYNKALMDYNDVFAVTEDLPLLIKDQATSYLSLEVKRGGKVHQAFLTLEFSHDQSTDVRIWLNLQETRFLIFDREPGPTDITLTVDLIALGLNQSDFDQSNFTLEIEDFSDQYSGSISAFQIELIHYQYPLGFEYVATIPRSENDTTVTFYLTLTDIPLNSENTSLYSYYSDGVPPNVSIPADLPVGQTIDLAKASSIQITAIASDQGGILSVEVYYRFSENDSWTIGSMTYDSETNLYVFNAPIPTPAGNMTFRIRAFDNSGLTASTIEYSISFTNGVVELPSTESPESSEDEDGGAGNLGSLLLLGLFALLALGVVGGGLIYLYNQKFRGGSGASIDTKVP